MEEKYQIPHRKICITVFMISCIILMVFYYDNTLLNFSVSYTTEEITWDVQNNSENVKDPHNPTNELIEPTTLRYHTIFDNSTAASTKTTILGTFSTLNNNYSTTPLSDIYIKNVTFHRKSEKYPCFWKMDAEDYKNNEITEAAWRNIIVECDITDETEFDFIISSAKCKMPNFQPFNKVAKKYYKQQKYKSCSSKKLLTYVAVIDNIATLYIDNRRVPSYSSNGVNCCYSNVSRVQYKKDPDNNIKLSPCNYFENNVTIDREPVYVKCLDIKSRKEVYENVHTAVVVDETVQKKIDNFDNTTYPFSVLFVGIDSISRLNFIRSLPNTYNFVEENGWIPLKGYNKMDDNTFPNLMAILTGFNQSYAYSVCNPRAIGKLDDCPLLWKDFRNLGYITGYAEDSASINTFNYRKKGFSTPPVDYYYRPYILATERLNKVTKDGMIYCTGPETAGERILNVAKDFSVTFKNYPYFGFFWMNSFSHNDVNSPSGMDDKVRHFLEEITNKGVTNNSIIIFLSDHGMRFGNIRTTDTGWLEERLPFIYVSFPDWFKQNFQSEYENFKTNTYRLTSPYDLHMTLKHILVLSGRNYNVTKSDACPTCRTLFEEAEPVRSCADAGIEQHWCTCAGYKRITLDTKTENKISTLMLDTIQNIIRSKNATHRCAKYTLHKILETRISQRFSSYNDTYILLQFQTSPKAVFESTIRYFGDINSFNFSLSGDISRLDSYDEHSKCVSDAYLRKYCYCRLTGQKI